MTAWLESPAHVRYWVWGKSGVGIECRVEQVPASQAGVAKQLGQPFNTQGCTKMDGILWIGSTRIEFRSMLSSIERATPLRRVATLAEARTASPPKVAILAQARPGEFAAAHVAELRTRWTGTRFVYVLGAWCCGQKRVNDEYSTVFTVYAHEWRDESILEVVYEKPRDLVPHSLAQNSGFVAVYSPVVSYREALADGLAAWGLRTVESEFRRTTRMLGVDTVVWHASPEFERRDEELETLLNRHPAARMIALLTDPREFELAHFRSHGVRVLAQPFDLSELVQAMQSAATKAASSAA